MVVAPSDVWEARSRAELLAGAESQVVVEPGDGDDARLTILMHDVGDRLFAEGDARISLGTISVFSTAWLRSPRPLL
jgi:hypothetical protein